MGDTVHDNRRVSFIAFIIAVTLWGFTFIAAKIALRDMGPFTLAFFRFSIATVILGPFAYREGFKLSMTFKTKFILLGLTGVPLTFVLQYAALKLTTAGNAALLFASLPAFTVLFSIIFLYERVSLRIILGFILSTLGVVLITLMEVGGAGKNIILGNMLMVGSMAAAAVYTVLVKKWVEGTSSLTLTVGGFASGLLLLVPFVIGELWVQGLPQISFQGALGVLFLGIGASALAFFLYNYGLRYVDAAVAAPFMNLTPVVGLLAALAIGESIGWLQIQGGAITILGVWLCTSQGDRNKDG